MEDNKRKRTSTNDEDHVEKKFKESIVTEDANGALSFDMTDREIISLMIPTYALNYPENLEKNRQVQVHRTRAGETVQGKFSNDRPVIIVWDCSSDPVDESSSDDETVPFCRWLWLQRSTRPRILPREVINNTAENTQSSASNNEPIVTVDLTSDDVDEPNDNDSIIIDLTLEGDDVILLFD